MRFLLPLILLFVFAGCAQQEPPPLAPPASPTPYAETSALNLFVAKQYPGWQLRGISESYEDCDISLPCSFEIDLTKGDGENVITVISAPFKALDGSSYSMFYEANKLDLIYREVQKRN